MPNSCAISLIENRRRLTEYGGGISTYVLRPGPDRVKSILPRAIASERRPTALLRLPRNPQPCWESDQCCLPASSLRRPGYSVCPSMLRAIGQKQDYLEETPTESILNNGRLLRFAPAFV